MKALKEKKHTAMRQMRTASFRPMTTRQMTFMMKKIRSRIAIAVRKYGLRWLKEASFSPFTACRST